MKIGSIKENTAYEKRVSITPDSAKNLIELGLEICIEKNYATHLGIEDKDFENLGVKILPKSDEVLKSSDLIVKINCPNNSEISYIRENSNLIGLLNVSKNKKEINDILSKKVNVFSLELLPRITRAQSMDVLSSQSNLAGYRSVIDSIFEFEKAIPMMMTAAGTVPPAKILIIGAGVAGLQAIATAKRLGAQVEAFDVRPEVKEQVESLGAKFIEVDSNSDDGVGSGGYASETSEEYKAKQQQLMKERVSKSDIVITTALIPNRPAPMLIPKSMVESMTPGSVIMDLASENGGNCELTQENEIVNHNGVLIDGNSNLPSTMAYHSSQLFSKNIEAIIDHCHSEEGFVLDKEDEIIDGMLFIENGEVRHQPTKESM